MKFTLEIKLGNAAMMDRMDVAGALERVSHTLAASPLPDDTQGIRDLNGATVGRWRLAFEVGDKVTRASANALGEVTGRRVGAIVEEYMPGMYEVRFPHGSAVIPLGELRLADEA